MRLQRYAPIHRHYPIQQYRANVWRCRNDTAANTATHQFHHLFSIDFSSIHRALVICHNGSTVWLSLLGNPCTFLWYATRHTIAEQPVGGGILAYCFRSLLQVVCTGFLIGGGERLAYSSWACLPS